MKKLVLIVFIAFVGALTCLCLVACGTEQQKKTVEFTVVIVDGEGFSVENNGIRVPRGGDAEFKIRLDAMRDIFSVDCEDYSERVEVVESDGAAVWYSHLTVKNVRSNMRVKITTGNPFDESEIRIDYILLGGAFSNGRTVKHEYPDLTYRLRANTDIGADAARSGYNLIGWNTRPDGSGIHIGLGSRVTVTKATRLYAEWVQHTDADDFEYDIEGGEAVITGYTGERELDTLCIPDVIDGAEVTKIGRNSIGAISALRVIIPRTVKEVEIYAFAGANIERLHFFDSIESVYNDAFAKGTLKYMHLNAARPPAYFETSINSVFADKLDMLIKNKDKKKIVFFSGCSMMYGLNCESMRKIKSFDDYELIDLGVIGGLSAHFQMQIISNYLSNGDIFLHAPEQYSPYSMMNDLTVDSRIFIMTECNYDLLSLIDLTALPKLLFDEYNPYQAAREFMPPSSYASKGQTDKINEYGNYIVNRPNTENTNKSEDGAFEDFDIGIITKDGVGRLNEFYSDFSARGVKVLYSYAPLSLDGMSSNCDVRYRARFHKRLTDLIDQTVCTVISTPEDYVYNGYLFSDTNYHLTTEGAKIRTSHLISDMIGYL